MIIACRPGAAGYIVKCLIVIGLHSLVCGLCALALMIDSLLVFSAVGACLYLVVNTINGK